MGEKNDKVVAIAKAQGLKIGDVNPMIFDEAMDIIIERGNVDKYLEKKKSIYNEGLIADEYRN